MKLLLAQRFHVLSEVKICKEQCVKRDLIEFAVRNPGVPTCFRSLINTGIQRAQRRLELMGNEFLERVQHAHRPSNVRSLHRSSSVPGWANSMKMSMVA